MRAGETLPCFLAFFFYVLFLYSQFQNVSSVAICVLDSVELQHSGVRTSPLLCSRPFEHFLTAIRSGSHDETGPHAQQTGTST